MRPCRCQAPAVSRIDATEIKVRAERRCGELLTKVERAPGKRPDSTSSNHETRYQQVLNDNKLPRATADRYQQLAAMPDEHFETAVETAITPGARSCFARSGLWEIPLDEPVRVHAKANLRMGARPTIKVHPLKFGQAISAEPSPWRCGKLGELTPCLERIAVAAGHAADCISIETARRRRDAHACRALGPCDMPR